MDRSPAFSVVVATCGDSACLPRTLELVRAQMRAMAAPGELVVAVNGERGSLPARRLAELEEACDQLVFEPRPGKSHALNRAVRACRGEVVAFIDDDALPEAGWLAALVEPMLADPELAGVGGRVLPVLPDEGVPRWYRYLVRGRQGYFLGPVHDLGPEAVAYDAANMGRMPLGTNSAFRRALLAEIGYAPELGPNRAEGTRGGEDLLMAKRVLDRGLRVVYEPRALVTHPVDAPRLTPRYVLEGYYWQGVEKVRLRRALGHEIGGTWPWKVRARYAKYLPLELVVDLLPESLAVLLMRRREFHRGILAELDGRAVAARPSLSMPGLRPAATGSSALVVVVVLAFALAAVLMASCGGRPSYDEPPNVLMFVIDTLRADHLSCYGHERETSPNLDAFARDALRFETVFAPSPRTVASHASLFTSLPPAAHGVWNEPAPGLDRDAYDALAPSAVCLAEVLFKAGYQTLGVADGGWLQVDRGLAQGFTLWDTVHEGVRGRVTRALERLAERDRRQPYFLFLHTYQVHTPLIPEDADLAPFDNGYQGVLREALIAAREAASTRSEAARLRGVHEEFFAPLEPDFGPQETEFMRRLYDAQIAVVDREFARLLEGLEAQGDLDNTIVIVTSDHGQEFGEHGLYDHAQVYDENLRVPLIVRLPDGHREQARGVRREPVSLLDVMPTLLTEIGLDVPPSAAGHVLDLHRAPERLEPRELWGEMREKRPQIVRIAGDQRALFAPGDDAAPRFFDVAADPLMAAPSDDGPTELARERLRLYRAQSAAASKSFELRPVPRSFDDLEASRLAELRALGYLGD
ncbi:MAG TPA: sulfatase-like hydrolase/transferase [Planctomycetota bacterium]|nr:sulfatase-like hydrolase/transferase [Planctomycetota bacterium]